MCYECMPYGKSHAYECISTDTSQIKNKTKQNKQKKKKTQIAGPWKARVLTSTSY